MEKAFNRLNNEKIGYKSANNIFTFNNKVQYNKNKRRFTTFSYNINFNTKDIYKKHKKTTKPVKLSKHPNKNIQNIPNINDIFILTEEFPNLINCDEKKIEQNILEETLSDKKKRNILLRAKSHSLMLFSNIDNFQDYLNTNKNKKYYNSKPNIFLTSSLINNSHINNNLKSKRNKTFNDLKKK